MAVFVFGCSLAANFIFNSTYGEGYYDNHKWPLAIALTVAGLLSWFIGQALAKRSDKFAIDEKTGQRIRVNQSNHALFFIPMHWWGPILFVLAIGCVIYDFTQKQL